MPISPFKSKFAICVKSLIVDFNLKITNAPSEPYKMLISTTFQPLKSN